MRAWTVDADDIRVAEDFDDALLTDGTLVIAGGDAVLSAARVEPHVEAGRILVTEEFRELLASTPSLWRTTLIPGAGDDERTNVKKGTEPDLWVRLYRLEF
jgi:class 3 adenylate cyclase